MEKRFLPADIMKAAYEGLHTLHQDKTDVNTFLVKLTDLIHCTQITNKATMINFIKNSTKILIIEHIYNTGTVPTTIKEYCKHIILLDDNDKCIESLQKGFAKPTSSSSSNWWDGTGTIYGGQGEPMDLYTVQ